MRDKQSKKGDGLMIVHNNKQAYTELEQVDTKQDYILILIDTLKNMKVTPELLGNSNIMCDTKPTLRI